MRPLARDTTPAIENQLRPFAVAVQPLARALAPASAKLAAAAPALSRTVAVLNELFNTLAYQPRGGQQGYLYWGAWLSHIAASLTSMQDANGPIVQGLFMGSCSSLQLLEEILQARYSVADAAVGPPQRPGLVQDPVVVLPRGRCRVNRKAPKPAQIVAMVAFAASCVGLLLFLWLSFGGSVPLEPKGYRFSVEFSQAVELGTQADVEISGVSVGKVVGVGLDRGTGLTRAVIEISPQFAPRPANTTAILRQKTLLGETYVQLSFGNSRGPMLADGGSLPQGQVAPSVQLDQILSTFDPATRQAFETWMTQDGMAFTARGEDFNAALAQLYPFATNVDSVLAVLRRDSAQTRVLLADGAQVLAAISASPARLQDLVRNVEHRVLGDRRPQAALQAAVRAFPAFLASTQQTVDRLRSFAGSAKPLVDELRPAAVALSPALQAIARIAPDLRTVMVDIGPLTRAARTGVPTLVRFLNE